MYLLTNLINSLENSLSRRGISESIIIRLSNQENFDFQINNLVKLEKSSHIKDIEKSFSKILDDDPIIKNFEFTKNYLINLEINIQMNLSNNENHNSNVSINILNLVSKFDRLKIYDKKKKKSTIQPSKTMKKHRKINPKINYQHSSNSTKTKYLKFQSSNESNWFNRQTRL